MRSILHKPCFLTIKLIKHKTYFACVHQLQVVNVCSESEITEYRDVLKTRICDIFYTAFHCVPSGVQDHEADVYIQGYLRILWIRNKKPTRIV